ncbi:hypothetical protein D3C73_1017850 [compost metagenome]
MCVQQHVHLIFKPVAGNLVQPVEHGRGEAAQSGLGVIDFSAGGEGEYASGHGVTETAAQRDLAAEAPAAEHNSRCSLAVERLDNPFDIMGQMLAVTVRTDDITGKSEILNIFEPALERPSFAEINDMGHNMAAEGLSRLKNPPVSRTAPVIHDHNRAELIVLQLNDQIQQSVVWFIGRN